MFADQTIVITGAGSGIGRTLALSFAKARAHVWVCDVNQESLDQLDEHASKFGYQIYGSCFDVTDKEALDRFHSEAMASRAGIDVWVNNAGIAGMGQFDKLSEDDFQRVIDINLSAVVAGTRLALTAMEMRGRGSIVNIASMAGCIPAPFMSAYVAAKFGVVGFTKSLTEELRLRKSPIHIMCVCPGFARTEILRQGGEFAFPEWLSFALGSPETIASEIINGLAARKHEIFPTVNGKLLQRMNRWLPGMTTRSSKLLLTKSWKDVLLNRYEIPTPPNS